MELIQELLHVYSFLPGPCSMLGSPNIILVKCVCPFQNFKILLYVDCNK